ncbi:hypothetical protein D3C76_1297730 [compost metagenome]
MKQRRRPGVVDHDQRLGIDALDRRRNGLDVDIRQERIGRCFKYHHVDLRRQGCQPLRTAQVEDAQLHTQACCVTLEKFVRTTVDKPVDHQRIARFEQFEHHVECTHARGVGQGMFAPFKGRNDLFKLADVGIRLSRIEKCRVGAESTALIKGRDRGLSAMVIHPDVQHLGRNVHALLTSLMTCSYMFCLPS